jgi:Protein of unknown function (DUF3800)
MLFFIDESWQSTKDNKYKAGVLSAIQIKSHVFNECSMSLHKLKIKHLGYKCGETELKGKHLLSNFAFKLEASGTKSHNLNLAREILAYLETLGTRFFASIVFTKKEIDLACDEETKLERPFLFLFERIDLFMKENHPGLMAKLIFDDRGLQTNAKLSKSVSNFFHRSGTGQSFDTIIKVPFFAISSENMGIQMADIGAHILGARFTGDQKKAEFFKKLKSLEFVSNTLIEINSTLKLPMRGFKVIKEKEAGDDLFSLGKTK